MPELPEIETIKNDLMPLVIGKIITNVTFTPDPKIRILRRFPSLPKFFAGLQGTRIQALRRRAKYLIFDLQPPRSLVMHLGMSGQLLFRRSDSPPEPFLRAVFHLSNGSELRFVDPRKFGELYLKLPSLKNCPLNLNRLGPEPLGKKFTVAYLTHIIQNSKRNIKTLLMDQRAIAGIGNIYSDEILFRTKIRPRRITSTLDVEEIKVLHRTIRKTLQEAINNRGTTAADKRYQDGLGRIGKFQAKLNVYQRGGKTCYECGSVIESVRIGGRTASFCPQCQK